MLPIAVALARARNAMLEIVLLGETAERLPETQAELGARAGRECPRGLRLWVPRNRGAALRLLTAADRDRTSVVSGKRGSDSVDLGGGRMIKKKTKSKNTRT